MGSEEPTPSSVEATPSSLPDDVRDMIAKAKVFVVGAGGIGCELIKNLVLVGFRNLEIIDLDTIDVSNLNRQFLFQKKHVGKSKAKVAHENAVTLRSEVKVVSHHASIFNPEYNMEFFKQFDIVLNALDNRAARNHVNRLCLATGVPLIESGSAGYLGQVNVIKKGATECYECTPKPRQKTFPGCTIRNTPSELIHCVVWAKYLFNQLFGEEDADQDVSPDTADPEADLESSAQLQRVSTRGWAKENEFDPSLIFNKLFNTDIEYLLSMEKLWAKRRPPTPVKWSDVSADLDTSISSQKVLSFEENMQLFGKSVTAFKELLKLQGEEGELAWDKDDEHAMNFVASAANLRAHVFNIPQKSIFEIKSMAGNIIPAIATTNAIVAGLIVMQALCILRNEFEKCRNVFLCRGANPNKKLIAPCVLDPPKPTCYVCAEKPEITIKLNTKKMTLGDFKDKVLKAYLGMISPDAELDGTATIVLSSEEGESDENFPKILETLGVGHGSRLRVDDFSQKYNIIVNVQHGEDLPEDQEFETVTSSGELGPEKEETKEKEEQKQDQKEGKTEEEEDQDLVVVEDNGMLESGDTKKRKLQSESDEQTAKKPRMGSEVIDEAENDIMVID